MPMIRSEVAGTNTVNWVLTATPQSNFTEGRDHPAQWPTQLVRKWLSRTPGDVVFDPFCGSGVVGAEAVRLGRSFIGIDLDPAYVAIARARIDAASRQGKLL